jgi:hypothetical protein
MIELGEIVSSNPGLFGGNRVNWLPLEWIIIHHSLTKDGITQDWNAIRRYHMSFRINGNIVTETEFERRLASNEKSNFERPWSDIGYNAGIEQVGSAIIVLPGRPLDKQGAHTQGFNNNSVGICVIGNYDYEIPDNNHLRAAAITAGKYMRVFGLSPIKIKSAATHLNLARDHYSRWKHYANWLAI